MANKTYINQSNSPIIIRNPEGVKELVKPGQVIELDAVGAKLAESLGMKDLSKVAKPAAGVAELQKENAALKKENTELAAKFAKATKDLEAFLVE
jgi:hypothetical protein